MLTDTQFFAVVAALSVVFICLVWYSVSPKKSAVKKPKRKKKVTKKGTQGKQSDSESDDLPQNGSDSEEEVKDDRDRAQKAAKKLFDKKAHQAARTGVTVDSDGFKTVISKKTINDEKKRKHEEYSVPLAAPKPQDKPRKVNDEELKKIIAKNLRHNINAPHEFSTINMSMRVKVKDGFPYSNISELIDPGQHGTYPVLDKYVRMLLTNPSFQFKVGLFIDLDGKALLNEFTSDSPWMLSSWYQALGKLQNGSNDATAYPCWVDDTEKAVVTLTALPASHPAAKGVESIRLSVNGHVKRISITELIIPKEKFYKELLEDGKNLEVFFTRIKASLAAAKEKNKKDSGAFALRMKAIADALPSHFSEVYAEVKEQFDRENGR